MIGCIVAWLHRCIWGFLLANVCLRHGVPGRSVKVREHYCPMSLLTGVILSSCLCLTVAFVFGRMTASSAGLQPDSPGWTVYRSSPEEAARGLAQFHRLAVSFLHAFIIAWRHGFTVALLRSFACAWRYMSIALLIAFASIPTILSSSPCGPFPSRAPSRLSIALLFAAASSDA